jgi:hypothetical protein
MPQVFRVPPPASRQCSSTVSRELVGTIGSSDKYKDKNKWNKYEDGHKDKYKQAALDLAQEHERPRVQPESADRECSPRVQPHVVGLLEQMKRGRGIKDLDDKSSGMEILMAEDFAKINPTDPLILGKQAE